MAIKHHLIGIRALQRVFMLSLAIVIAVALGHTTPATAALSDHAAYQAKQKGVLLFYSNRSGNKDIWLINPDGTGLSQLTNDPANDLLPTWSPDAKRIVFTSERDGDTGIFVMNANGSGQKRLFKARGGSPIWSPDGKKIQYLSAKNGEAEAYISNADGTGDKKLLIRGGSNAGFFSWSPDSKKLIYAAGEDNDSLDLYIINADGSGEKRVFKDKALRSAPAWSPDGKQIAYTVIDQAANSVDIYIANIDGTKAKRITDNKLINIGASWSPDGKQLAFSAGGRDTVNIFTINVDGTNQQQLTEGQYIDYLPMWSTVTPAIKLPLPTPKTNPASVSTNCPLESSKDKTYGYTEENPIKVGGGAFEGPSRQRAYFSILHGPKGEKVQFDRTNSQPSPTDPDVILDRYEVTYTGLSKPAILYVDQYTEDVEPQIPVGFTCDVPQ